VKDHIYHSLLSAEKVGARDTYDAIVIPIIEDRGCVLVMNIQDGN
jgi:hypothetical protein